MQSIILNIVQKLKVHPQGEFYVDTRGFLLNVIFTPMVQNLPAMMKQKICQIITGYSPRIYGSGGGIQWNQCKEGTAWEHDI
jgi:hypothetical protein